MKKIIIIAIIMFVCNMANAQNLIDLYKSGPIKLIQDTGYGTNIDWDKALASWTDTTMGRWVGDRKSLKIAPDGSAFVSHHFKDFYTVISPDGQSYTELQIKNNIGRTVRSLPHFKGVLGNNIYYTGLTNMGIMYCFDKKGEFLKTLQLDYMARQIIPLTDKKFALVGWVLWSDKVREFVAIVDYDTNEETIIWDHFNPRSFGGGSKSYMFNYQYKFKEGGMISFSTMPFVRALGMSRPPLIARVRNYLILAIPETGEIRRFDFKGNLISTQTIDWAKSYVSVEEQKEIQQKAIDKYRNMRNPRFANWASEEENKAALKYFIDAMEKDLKAIERPITMPVFSSMLKDSDDNLLFFEFPKEEGDNNFNVWVYSDKGSFVAKSSFQLEGYDLEIKPSKLVFHNGYLYALLLKKGISGIPLRVERFRLSN